MRIATIVAIGLIGVACHPSGQEDLRRNEAGPSPNVQVSSAMLAEDPGVEPGNHPVVKYGDLRNPYANNAAAAAEGRQLFVQYNCSGCHGGRAGGGMGPSLRTGQFTYGGSDTDLFATIFEGRPAGMPTWGAKLSSDQIWKVITYIRTLDTPQEPDRPPPEDHPPT
jgi:cytochrome c oxidase cbb3-type subunit III